MSLRLKSSDNIENFTLDRYLDKNPTSRGNIVAGFKKFCDGEDCVRTSYRCFVYENKIYYLCHFCVSILKIQGYLRTTFSFLEEPLFFKEGV